MKTVNLLKTVNLIATVAATLLLSLTLGCGPAAPTDVSVDTSTSGAGSNVTAAGGNVTAGTDTPVSETP